MVSKEQENLNVTGVSAVRRRENGFSYTPADIKSFRGLKPLSDDDIYTYIDILQIYCSFRAFIIAKCATKCAT